MTTKTIGQLEREWREYTARPARPKKKVLKRAAPGVAILARHITTMTGGKALWGKFRHWANHKDNVANLKEAMRDAIAYLHRQHIGTIIYVTLVGSKNIIPIWEAKWGHDGAPFISWKPNPVAAMWKRRVGSKSRG